MAVRGWRIVGSALAMSAWFAASSEANDLSSDEDVVFFETAVPYDLAAPQTTLSFHGWIFEPESSSFARQMTLGGIARMCGFDRQEEASALFRKRAAWFLVDNERNQRLVIGCGERKITLPVSQENGHIRAQISLPNDELAGLVQTENERRRLDFKLVMPAGDARNIPGRVHLIGPTGWSVVSDIDDTIKDSNVLDKQELLRNTFLREFKAVPGVADRYAAWSDGGAAFHYVTGSPWQLYPALHEFAAAQKFPLGSWHLRHCRIQDGSITDLLHLPEEYKVTAIDEILRTYPRRHFILVGDTGEKDPEVYGELARRYPAQVRLIALRNITNESLDGPRLQAALRQVSRDKVTLFRQPSELPALDGIN